MVNVPDRERADTGFPERSRGTVLERGSIAGGPFLSEDEVLTVGGDGDRAGVELAHPGDEEAVE